MSSCSRSKTGAGSAALPETSSRAPANSRAAAGSASLATELTDLVIRELSAHKRPREVRFVEGLPRNELGKVQKSRLR